jgi:subtilase family serine protease
MSFGISPGFWSLGGTSAGSPQWAAIRALGGANINNSHLYQVASYPVNYAADFRDITTGSNSSFPNYYSSTHIGYDYVTGLGSPLGTGLLTGVENWKDQHFDMDDSLFQ